MAKMYSDLFRLKYTGIFLAFFLISEVYTNSDTTKLTENLPGRITWRTRLLERYLEIEDTSVLNCVKECLQRKRCKSFNYSRNMKYCELCYVEKTKGTTDSNEIVADIFIHSDIKTWNKELFGGCQLDNCSINSKCHIPPGTCQPSDCGPAKPFENAILLTHGNHKVGNGVIYGCENNMQMVDGKGIIIKEGEIIVTCKENGEWENETFSCKETSCQKDWEKFENHCYSFRTEKKSWAEAENLVSAVAYVHATAKVICGREKPRKKKKPGPTIWIGGVDIDNNYVWTWTSDSSLVVFTSWQKGEPNKYRGRKEQCISSSNGLWNDALCHITLPFVCEKTL